MSTVSQLPLIQRYLTRYGMTTYTILGNIGLLLNIAIFIQPKQRRIPCSLYILAASICGLIGLNLSVIPVIYALDHFNILTSSIYICNLQFYFRHAFNQMMRSYFIFAYADRYLISSTNVRIRSFSHHQKAIRVIICVAIFWFLLSIFPTMLRSLENGKCEAKNGVYSMIFSIYISVVLGLLPLVSMTVFTVLLKINLKKLRGRIQPMTIARLTVPQHLRKRDRDMLRMVLIEFIAYMVTTTPAWILPFYKSATQDIVKSSERQTIETFVMYFANTFLLFSNNSFSFWIYIGASRSFRSEFKNLLIRCYELITGKQMRPNVT